MALFTFFVSLEQILLCFHSPGRVARLFFLNGLCRATWHIPKLATLLVPDSFQLADARLRRVVVGIRRRYSDPTFSVLVTFHLINTVCLWSLSFRPEALPAWQCGAQGGGCVQRRCIWGQNRSTETQQWSLLAVLAAVK